MVGSEGTLGIITEVGLKLHSFPESISSAVCEFKELKVSALHIYDQWISPSADCFRFTSIAAYTFDDSWMLHSVNGDLWVAYCCSEH